MAIKLGELLIKKNLLTQAQLEEALQAQVIFGGTLGTILIEMGLISENVLAEILSNLINIPCLKPDQLENIPEHVIKIISPELAEKHKVVPVAVNGKKLTLAMESPHDLKSIDEISFRTGYIVQPILALEVRLIFALEEYYGVKRAMRYIAPPKHVRDELDKAPIFHTPDGPIPAAEDDGDLSEPGSEQIYQRPDKTAAKEAEEKPAEGIEELDDIDVIEDLVDEEVTLESTSAALVKTADRNDVADAIITYLGANYARAALFMVMAGQVTGWRSAKDGVPIPGFDQLQLPLSEPSVLKTAVDSNSFVLGPIQQSGANLALTTFLGKPAPTTALLMPMSILGRVVGLIYVDDPDIDLSQAVVDVQHLASKALMAFEILILHNKILRS
ncbi:MAG: hypothetical protein AB1Z51_12305 [Desulfuromonadales bacterium]